MSDPALRRRPIVYRLVTGGLLVAWVIVTFVAAGAREPDTDPLPSGIDQVVVFGVPGLTLGDLSAESMPNLAALADRGAVGASNVRGGGTDPDIAEAYVTLGAGYRVESGGQGSRAVDRRSSGPGTAVQVLDMPEPSHGRDRTDVGEPGAMATALAAVGKSTAVLTNADVIVGGVRHRAAPAAAAVADRSGVVGAGSVGRALTVSSPTVAGGLEASRGAFRSGLADVMKRSDVVMIDPGDTTRARRMTEVTSRAPTGAQWSETLRSTDRIIGDVAKVIGPETVLIVMGVTPPGSTWRFTPVVMTGGGIGSGHLESPSTHRRDLITITDIAPTILHLVGSSAPASMTGHALEWRPGPEGLARIGRIDDMLESRRSTDQPFTLVFILVQSALYAAGVLALMRAKLATRAGSLLIAGVLTCAAWPLATFWVRASVGLSSLGVTTGVVTWLIAAGVGIGATRVRRHPLDPLLVICGLFVATIVIDLSTGANLQFGSFFGYSPNKGTRFTGLGNAAFALLGAATIVVCTSLVLRARRRADGWWAAVMVAGVVVVADGAPWLGADVGGILALVPVLVLLLWAMHGSEITLRKVGFAVGAAMVVLGIAVGFDALRPPDQRTHLSRFFLNLGNLDLVRSTIGVKWSANMRILSQSAWAWLVPITVALSLVALTVGRLWERALPPGSPQRYGVTATLALALTGWLMNDSGIVVVALASVYVGPYVLLVARANEERRLAEALGGDVPDRAVVWVDEWKPEIAKVGAGA